MPFAALALGYALGLFAGGRAGLALTVIALLAAALAAAWLRAREAGLRAGLAALLLAGALLGLARADPLDAETPAGLEPLIGLSADLRGVVAGLPEAAGQSVRLRVDVAERRTPNGWAPAEGAAIVWVHAAPPPVDGRSYPYLRHGDTVVVRGPVRAPERIGPFDYPEHLAARGVRAVVSPALVLSVAPGEGGFAASVHVLRSRLAESLEASMPEPAAGLAAAMLLGLRSGVSAETSDAFRGAGLAHLLAISGMHVGIVLGLAMLASRALLGRRRGLYLVAPFLLVWAYVLLAGAPPSAVRAALMASAFLLALAAGRLPTAVNALGLAAFVMLLVEPRTLWDRSFQLSFSAMAGVLFIGLPVRAWAAERAEALRDRLPAAAHSLAVGALSGLIVSLGAFLGAAPLVAFNFGAVPLLGAPATLAALAVMPLFLGGAALAAAVGLLLPPLAAVLGWLPALLGLFLAGLADATAAVPGSSIAIEGLAANWVWGAYALGGAAAAVALRRRWTPAAREVLAAVWRGPASRVEGAAVLILLLVLAAAPWVHTATAGDGLLHLDVLDAGQGDALLLTTPSGATALIDGGPNPRETIAAIDGLLPLGKLRIDVAILTHAQADHMNGLLELARRGRIDRVVAPPPAEDDRWDDELAGLGVPVVEAVRGMTVALPDGVLIEALNPPDPPIEGTASYVNNNGIAARVSYRDASALLMADLFVETEYALIDDGLLLDADILKAGHHGSRSSTSQELLDAASPVAAVISAGADNPFGHPAPEVVERLSAAVGADRLFLTAEHGRVRFSTDGSRWWVSTER